MFMKFTFWLVRFLCLAGFAISVTFINIHNFASAMFHIFGLFAALNIYVEGLLKHELLGVRVQGEDMPSGERSKPAAWISFRIFQLLILLVTDTSKWPYLVVYVAADVIVFAAFVLDSRYNMMLVPQGTKVKKTIIVEE